MREGYYASASLTIPQSHIVSLHLHNCRELRTQVELRLLPRFPRPAASVLPVVPVR